MKYIFIIFIVFIYVLLFQCKALEQQQAEKQMGGDVHVQIEYNRYIITEGVKELRTSNLRYTPIVPQQFMKIYSSDTLYVFMDEKFQGESLRLSTKDTMFFSEVLHSNRITGLAARTVLAMSDDIRILTITFDNHSPVEVHIDTGLNFLLISYIRSQQLLLVEQTNRAPQYR